MTDRYFRWRLSPTFLAHVAKAALLQHHRELAPVLRRLLREDAIVVDVGAHAGQFTKLFAKLVPAGLVVAVEPGSYARAILRLALYLNRVRNVVVVPAGLAARCGVETLRVPIKRPGSYGFGLSHLGAQSSGVEARFEVAEDVVPVVTLDQLSATLKLSRLDFLKADIEGFELRMIEGGAATLKTLRPILLLELVDDHLRRAGDSLEAAWRRLSGLGYAPRVLDSATGAFRDAKAPTEGDIWWFPDGGAHVPAC
jgi:FkbM family methyltransferase